MHITVRLASLFTAAQSRRGQSPDRARFAARRNILALHRLPGIVFICGCAPLGGAGKPSRIRHAFANQYLEQVHPAVRAAALGNAGTLMVFRVSSNDAELLAPEFHPLPAPELADQSAFTAWLRRGDTGHRAIYLEPSLYPDRNRRHHVVAQNRQNFGRPRRH
jgi:hypothetical protein